MIGTGTVFSVTAADGVVRVFQERERVIYYRTDRATIPHSRRRNYKDTPVSSGSDPTPVLPELGPLTGSIRAFRSELRG
ncbi:hypothetical protein NJ7G_1011 [Natrinema sp. J7-2]|nr:hypothetical protein NJ7G_1011 [Natrinema sp. J7-2]